MRYILRSELNLALLADCLLLKRGGIIAQRFNDKIGIGILRIDFFILFFDFFKLRFALLVLRAGESDFFLLLAQLVVTLAD